MRGRDTQTGGAGGRGGEGGSGGHKDGGEAEEKSLMLILPPEARDTGVIGGLPPLFFFVEGL